MNEPLAMWTIFCSPRDYPGKYVLRRFDIGPGQVKPALVPSAVGDTLEEVRKALPIWLVCFPRGEQDVPTIVESWM